jgi:hypothetical protein
VPRCRRASRSIFGRCRDRRSTSSTTPPSRFR